MSHPVPTPPRVCEFCGATFERRPGQRARVFNRQRFCNAQCSTGWRAALLTGRPRKSAARAEELLEDLEWIIDSDCPERIAKRLGYERPDSLIRTLARWGRHDLANRLERAS